MTNQVLRKEKGRLNGSVGAGVNAPKAAPGAAGAVDVRDDHASAKKPTLTGTCVRYKDVAEGNDKRPLCGAPVADGQDWCKKCPGYKKATVSKQVGDTQARPTPEDAIPVGRVQQCSGTVTDARTNEERQCKNAILTPSVHCHDHGGDIQTSLFKTYAKATAEASRGELTVPTAEELATNPDAGRALMERDLLNLIESDPSAFLKLAQAASAFNKEHTVGRFSPSNQLMVMAYAYRYERLENPERDKEESLTEAIARSNQMMHTKKGWLALGREVDSNGHPVPVMFYSPGEKTVAVEEEAADGSKETVNKRVYAPRWGVRVQYFADQTSGDELPANPDPLDIPLPAGHGDPAAYRAFLEGEATRIGVSVVTDATPRGSAKAFYNSQEQRIHLWEGHAGGDSATQAHTLAHELGHALDPKLNQKSYANRGCNERGRAEVFAETFAFLMSGRYGIDSQESSAGYATGWAKGLGGLGSREAMSVMKDALTAAHSLLYK